MSKNVQEHSSAANAQRLHPTAVVTGGGALRLGAGALQSRLTQWSRVHRDSVPSTFHPNRVPSTLQSAACAISPVVHSVGCKCNNMLN